MGLSSRKELVEGLDTSIWKKAVQLVEEGNVKLEQPARTHTQFKVIGDSDAYTVGVDMDSREAKCSCEDKYYREGTCKHELAVHLVLMSVGLKKDDASVLDELLENPEFFVREERL